MLMHAQANAEKKRLEVKQRAVRKAAEQRKDPLDPVWFERLPNSTAGETAMYRYKGDYWEARKTGDWQRCRQIITITNRSSTNLINTTATMGRTGDMAVSYDAQNSAKMLQDACAAIIMVPALAVH